MTIEIQFNSITILSDDMQDHPLMFSDIQKYLPVQKTPKRRRLRKKRQTVAHLIDALIDTIDRGSG